MTIVYPLPGEPKSSLTPYRSLIRAVGPVVEPVSLAEAKSHCRVDTNADDAYISSLIAAAREYVEERLDATLITTTWEARYDAFPMWELVLPRPPMQAANVTVTYRDQGGANQSITSSSSAFQIDAFATPGRVYPNFQGVWPPVRGDENSVIVRWTGGYGTSGASVPATIKHGILLIVGHWYANREAVTSGNAVQVPLTFETLMASSGWGGYR